MVYFQLFLSVIIWGAALAFTKRALAELSPCTLIMIRCALSVAVIRLLTGPFTWLKELSRAQWLKVAAAAALGIILTQLLQAYAMMNTSATHAGWLAGSTPILVAAALIIFFGHKIGKLRLAGFALGFCGVALVVGSRQTLSGATVIPTGFGDFLFIISCFVWAAYVILQDRWFRSFPQARLNALGMMISLAVMLALSLIQGGLPAVAHVSGKGWAAILYLGILSSGYAYTFWNIGVEKLGPAAAASFLYFEPFASMLSGRLLFGEQLSPRALFGGLMILAGVYWINGGRAGALTLRKIYLAVMEF